MIVIHLRMVIFFCTVLPLSWDYNWQPEPCSDGGPGNSWHIMGGPKEIQEPAAPLPTR